MPEDRTIETDILVIGGAMAGLYGTGSEEQNRNGCLYQP